MLQNARLALLRRYLAPQARTAVLTGLLLLAATGLRLAAPRVARTFINGVSGGESQERLLWLAASFVGLSLAAQTMKVLAEYGSERVAWTATNALRLDLTGHLLRLDASFHKARTPGELIERVDGDVGLLSGFFAKVLPQVTGSLLLLAGVLVLLWAESWQLGLAFTGLALLTGLALNLVRRLAVPDITLTRERSALYYGTTGEVLGATEDLRASGAVAYALQRVADRLRAWMQVALRAELLGMLVWVSAIAAFALVDAMAVGLSGWLYGQGALSLGTVYMVMAYAALLAQPIEMLRSQMQELQKAATSMARVGELMATRSRVADGGRELPAGPLAVEFDAVGFGYGEGSVLQNLSFRLEPGRRLGLVGRTGSGKSTIARLLFRMYDPEQGAVRLGGVDLREARLAGLRNRVGLVTQEVQIFAATLRENLTFFDPAVPAERLVAVLEEVGLGPWLQRLPQGLETPLTPSALSAGEAQLLAFARVFLKDPGLVILDEASSRLDPATEALLERAVDRLLAGRTAIIIAHRLHTVARADQILRLEEVQG